MNDPLRVAVVGATGYAGYELARLLLRHPKIDKPTFYLRDGNANVRCLTELYPQLRGWGEAPCRPLSAAAIAASGADVAFLSTPHEASLELVPELLAANPKIADCRFERCVPLSRTRNIRALVQAQLRPHEKFCKKPCTGFPSCMRSHCPKPGWLPILGATQPR